MSQRITRQDRDGLCTLILNRPDKLNALDTRAFEELDTYLAALEGETDSVGCVVLRGRAGGSAPARTSMPWEKRPSRPPSSPV